MRLGIVLPHELEDPGAVRAFVQAVDEMGYDHILFSDHVIGGNPATHQINGPYTHKSFFHEPMVTMGYAAALTRKVELLVGVMVLPQRQTGLVAKQAAEVDYLSGGRLRLGVGVGWNQVEFEVLGMPFHDRGRRIEEQIAVLRRMWTEELVTFQGAAHSIRDAGINPLPVRRPIPIWLGGWSDPVIDRLARLGDGWLLFCGLEEGKACLEKLEIACERVGRRRDEIGVESWVFLNKSDVMAGANQKPGAHEVRSPEEWAREAAAWKAAGATHIDCWTAYNGIADPEVHIALARQFKEVVEAL